MRGSDKRPGSLFSYVDLEARVRRDHPLRAIRQLVDAALEALTADFTGLYSGMGRPSIPPEMLLRAMLLQAFYSIRSERQLMERLEFDLLFRWFVGLGVDDPAWDHSTFSKNRDRLLEGEIAARFLSAVLAQPRVKRLLSTDHFSVDGTLIEAWASMKGGWRAWRAAASSPRPTQRRGRFQGPEAVQRDPPEHHRSRGAALPQGLWHGSQARLPRPRADGKPLGPDRGGLPHPG
jgi:transposase